MDEEREVTPNENDEVSLRWLIRSLARGAADALRHNKLAAVLAAVTLAVLTALAVDNRFDGLSHYQEAILPRLLRLETGFHASLRIAGDPNTSADWRRYYFGNAQSQVRDILRAARLDRPDAYVAAQKHREFIRYYESIELEFHGIGLQLTVNPHLDYLKKLTAKMEEVKPIRDRWAGWALPHQ